MKILIAVPCYKEGSIINDTLKKLTHFLQQEANFDYKIIVSENGSMDQTENIIKNLSNDRIQYLYTDPGKGQAVIGAWANNQADVYVFMDADLSTDLTSLKPLVDAIGKEGFDIAMGSRFHPDSKVNRSFFRKFLSLFLNKILRVIFKTKLRDTTCGFKAVNEKVKSFLLPKIKNHGWFFDTELLILAEKNSYKIKEIPVNWSDEKERRNSRVEPVKLSLNYLKEIIKLKKRIK